MTTAESIADKQARVIELRDQLAAENQQRLDYEAQQTDAVLSAQLDTEVARLEREIELAKSANSAAQIASVPGASTSDAKAAMQAAAGKTKTPELPPPPSGTSVEVPAPNDQKAGS